MHLPPEIARFLRHLPAGEASVHVGGEEELLEAEKRGRVPRGLDAAEAVPVEEEGEMFSLANLETRALEVLTREEEVELAQLLRRLRRLVEQLRGRVQQEVVAGRYGEEGGVN